MTVARTAPLLVAALLITGCPKRVPEDAVPKSGPPRPFQLLAETPERETTQIEELREDVEVDTRDFDRTPRVVAMGETPILELKGARARLYGDAEMSQGWSVDNFLLLEVLDESGKVLSRANAGFAQGVLIGAERVDNLGRMAFAFEPGEIDITALLPERKPFKIRATALDNGGVGRVTDVYVVLAYPERGGGDDDLRGDE